METPASSPVSGARGSRWLVGFLLCICGIQGFVSFNYGGQGKRDAWFYVQGTSKRKTLATREPKPRPGLWTEGTLLVSGEERRARLGGGV